MSTSTRDVYEMYLERFGSRKAIPKDLLDSMDSYQLIFLEGGPETGRWPQDANVGWHLDYLTTPEGLYLRPRNFEVYESRRSYVQRTIAVLYAPRLDSRMRYEAPAPATDKWTRAKKRWYMKFLTVFEVSHRAYEFRLDKGEREEIRKILLLGVYEMLLDKSLEDRLQEVRELFGETSPTAEELTYVLTLMQKRVIDIMPPDQKRRATKLTKEYIRSGQFLFIEPEGDKLRFVDTKGIIRQVNLDDKLTVLREGNWVDPKDLKERDAILVGVRWPEEDLKYLDKEWEPWFHYIPDELHVEHDVIDTWARLEQKRLHSKHPPLPENLAERVRRMQAILDEIQPGESRQVYLEEGKFTDALEASLHWLGSSLDIMWQAILTGGTNQEDIINSITALKFWININPQLADRLSELLDLPWRRIVNQWLVKWNLREEHMRTLPWKILPPRVRGEIYAWLKKQPELQQKLYWTGLLEVFSEVSKPSAKLAQAA